MSGHRGSAQHVPAGFWARADVLDALDDRDFGRLFSLIRRHTGASQSRIGAAVDLSQGTISDVVRAAKGQVEQACRLVTEALDLHDGTVVMPILARANEVVTGMARWRNIACVRATTEHLHEHGRRTGRRELRALGRPQLPGRLSQ